ncbi:MAG: nicotinate (nicotinamide) nucleotide adenylyltransferase [Opitutales bacterium]|nr:nicotinate (nicotinamide) nucleotide adenylyltransferase [Opitutales bacterium]
MTRTRKAGQSPLLGIFGGTFDPVHHGHLLVAQDALESVPLEKVIFVPAARNPLKGWQPAASDRHRLEMVRRAIEGVERFSVDPVELERGGPSYAIDTVAALQESHPQARFAWIIGADQLADLPKWHRFDELALRVTFLVLERPGYESRAPSGLPGHLRLEWLPSRALEISSSEIRSRCGKGKPVDFFLPGSVIQYIQNEHLYHHT